MIRDLKERENQYSLGMSPLIVIWFQMTSPKNTQANIKWTQNTYEA